MLWVLKRLSTQNIKNYVKIDGQENIHNFTIKNCVDLNLRL